MHSLFKSSRNLFSRSDELKRKFFVLWMGIWVSFNRNLLRVDNNNFKDSYFFTIFRNSSSHIISFISHDDKWLSHESFMLKITKWLSNILVTSMVFLLSANISKTSVNILRPTSSVYTFFAGKQGFRFHFISYIEKIFFSSIRRQRLYISEKRKIEKTKLCHVWSHVWINITMQFYET